MGKSEECRPIGQAFNLYFMRFMFTLVGTHFAFLLAHIKMAQ